MISCNFLHIHFERNLEFNLEFRRQNLYIFSRPAYEASLIVPDFTISVCGSSFNFLLFCCFLACLRSLSNSFQIQGRMGCNKINRERKEERMILKNRYLHELLSTDKVKSGRESNSPSTRTCDFLFFGLVLSPLLSLSIYYLLACPRPYVKPIIRPGKLRMENMTKKETIAWIAYK